MRLCLFLFLCTLGFAAAITPAELDARLKAHDKVTVIDLRSTELFQRGHIIGAINIPHRLVAKKKLPPLGEVVAYCDGLGATYAADCVASLNAKPGIQAEALNGGYAAWKTFTHMTAEAQHIRKATPTTMTYEQLMATGGKDVVLVDARQESATMEKSAAGTAKAAVDLQKVCKERIPAASVVSSGPGALRQLRSKQAVGSAAPSLFVVLDNDHESAMKIAQAIEASGYKRVVVLAGGEEILRRKGKEGLSRQGAAAPVILEPPLKPQPVADKGGKP